jgi:hypothetical protein
VVTGATAFGTAAVTQIPIVFRDIRQAGRDLRDRRAEALRQACLSLLGAAGSLLIQVQDAVEHRGGGLGDRLAEIRRCNADVQLHATNVQLLAPGTLAGPAGRLAVAAGRYAVAAITGTDPAHSEIVRSLDAEEEELSQAIDFFRGQAVTQART